MCERGLRRPVSQRLGSESSKPDCSFSHFPHVRLLGFGNNLIVLGAYTCDPLFASERRVAPLGLL